MKKIYLTLITCLMTVMLSYSQSSQKSITPIKDSINIQLHDSVRIPLFYLKQANKCFLEVKSLRSVTLLYKDEILIKDNEINNYKLSGEKCKQAYDTLNKVTIPLLQKENDDYNKLYTDFKSAYKKEKVKKIGLSISLPVAVILSFLFGFYLHK